MRILICSVGTRGDVQLLLLADNAHPAQASALGPSSGLQRFAAMAQRIFANLFCNSIGGALFTAPEPR
jgi:glutamine synthetase adenylyltransferase